jgi:hypothetical protein
MDAQFTSSDSEQLPDEPGTDAPTASEQAPMGDPDRPVEETTERTHGEPRKTGDDDMEDIVGPEPERDFVDFEPTKPVGGTA